MNMIFNASAGTGKTWRVTELYADLVLGRPSELLSSERKPVAPEKILLMTFTDNAAAELCQRVSGKMMAVKEEDDLARLVLRKLPAANISTIHAFCAGLLRENALELGLSPTFQTLEDEERNVLLDEVLKAEIFQTLETDKNFREFCAGLSVLGDHEYSLINTIRSLLEKAASRGLNLSRAEQMLPDPVPTIGKNDFQKIRQQLAVIDAERGLPSKAAGVFQTLEKILEKFPMVGNFDGLTRFTGKGMKEISDELADVKERFLTETLYAENISTFRAFARCLARCATGFAEAKRLRDCVDFGDQLLFARDLLRGGDHKNLFEWIIVDEVQDTSCVQCELIEALWGSQTNLVVCGDKKQSIYAWRSADPSVMPDLEAAMRQRGDCKRIDLKTSYRSKDRVIDAVNELFSGIYDPYDALEPRGTLDREKPCVEFLEADNDEQGSDEEMAAVARRIRLLVDGDDEWRPKFGHNGKTFAEGEPFNYGDILILLKRSTHQPVLEKALRAVGIPYTSGGKGRALFEQQEVRDLLLFLQVLTQPENDLALVGFLRSPFANLPDDEIVTLGWDGENFDHEILRRQFFESSSEAAQRILRYRAQTGKKLASQLVREMVRETAFDAQLAGQPGGEQKLANFKKALDWIRGAERGGQVLLPDVVRRFGKYIKSPPRSGAAEALLPDPEQNAVTIMTVHGAKGLTKRVCFVPDISFGDVTEPGFAMFSPQGTLEMSLSGLTGDKVKSPGWDAAREADKAVRDLESTNVFYVAMTRARDLVVLSGAGTKRISGWMKLSESFLATAKPEILRKLNFTGLPETARELTSDPRPLTTEVFFQPLEISAGVERRTVTSLCGKNPSIANRQSSIINPARYGTIGHSVLEELARNRWAGDIELLVDQVGGASLSERAVLIEQLEAARVVLREETAGATALFAEHPFVLKRGDELLDGTIDLLAQISSKHLKILDYKFTNESPEAVLETYSPQLTAYREAVEKLNPGAEVSALLVLIRLREAPVRQVGESVRLISLPAQCR